MLFSTVFFKPEQSFCRHTTWMRLRCWATALPSWNRVDSDAVDHHFTSRKLLGMATISRSPRRRSVRGRALSHAWWVRCFCEVQASSLQLDSLLQFSNIFPYVVLKFQQVCCLKKQQISAPVSPVSWVSVVVGHPRISKLLVISHVLSVLLGTAQKWCPSKGYRWSASLFSPVTFQTAETFKFKFSGLEKTNKAMSPLGDGKG